MLVRERGFRRTDRGAAGACDETRAIGRKRRTDRTDARDCDETRARVPASYPAAVDVRRGNADRKDAAKAADERVES
jgi:hypothetical protein